MAGVVAMSLPGAYRFTQYYEAFDAAGENLTGWERVLYSLALASEPAPETGLKSISSWRP